MPAPTNVPVWRTCLREVLFFNDAEAAAKVGEPIVEGDAYRLLLEIVCGLRSPMLGETQVMGQFKAFLGTLDDRHGPLRKVGQRLLSEARRISERHLRHLGARSYGSATSRRIGDCARVAVIGTGALAGELLKYVADGRCEVDQWGRRFPVDVVVREHVSYRQIGDAGSGPLTDATTALVIAAPVPSTIVDAIARRYPGLRRVVDLRGETDLGPLDVSAPIVTLAEIFSEMTAARRDAVAHIEAARAGVTRLSREYELRDESRPFGWDDLCA
jgi:glutamyl-tRNA reductase